MENLDEVTPSTPQHQRIPFAPTTPRKPQKPLAYPVTPTNISPFTPTRSLFTTPIARASLALPGTPTTRSPRQYQHEPTFDKISFSALITTMASELIPGFEFEDEAIAALQAAAEDMVVKGFELMKSHLAARRVEFEDGDVELIRIFKNALLSPRTP